MPIDTWWLVVIYIGNGILIAMFVISNSDDFVSIQYKDTNTHLWYEDPLGSKVKLKFDKSANSAMKRNRYVARLLESHKISTNKFYNSIVVIFLRNLNGTLPELSEIADHHQMLLHFQLPDRKLISIWRFRLILIFRLRYYFINTNTNIL